MGEVVVAGGRGGGGQTAQLYPFLLVNTYHVGPLNPMVVFFFEARNHQYISKNCKIKMKTKKEDKIVLE